MADSNKKSWKSRPNVKALFDSTDAVLKNEGVSIKKFVDELLSRHGYCLPRLYKIKDEKRLFLDDDVKTKLEEYEKEEKGLQRKSVMQYVIYCALKSFVCYNKGKKLTKKEIADFLGYSDRTMRDMQRDYEEIKDYGKEKKEHIVYEEILEILKPYIVA